MIKKYEKQINWFPGHMVKAIRKIKERLKSVDIVLEVRDARSPLATGNDTIEGQVGEKSRLIVMNKTNLAGQEIVDQWKVWFEAKGRPFIFVNGFDKKSLDKVVIAAREVVTKRLAVDAPGTPPKAKLKMMIIGLPNTGKSTIINRLSGRNATKVGDKPGQTQQQLWVYASKDLDILDTPGVMTPNIKTEEQAFWLAALHALPEHIYDVEDTACFIMRHLLKTNPEAVVSHYKLDSVNDDLVETLNKVAVARGCLRRGKEYDYERVYKLLIADFRDGKLGLVNFGLPPEIKQP